MTNLDILREALSKGACVNIHGVLIDNIDYLEFGVLKGFTRFILRFLIFRYIFIALRIITRRILKKELLIEIPYKFRDFKRFYFNKESVEMEIIDVFQWLSSLCIIVVEFSLVAMFQVLLM